MSMSDAAIRAYVKNSYECGLFDPNQPESELKVEDVVFTIQTLTSGKFKVIPLEKNTNNTAKAIEKFLNKPLPSAKSTVVEIGHYQTFN
ncbi:hypothetical protein D5018_19280 [Parashewanella curva]|uniref:Uncharacterized protein n=1 Tax=Parashewanella curva TaxID=2338552 RepID=A0A3L8PS51_9GAMM|nr:hypothetical protein [Parashewanella curva]RLV58064.1 hypothetical protein D5018_19280 [Parashewanella curva]